MIGCCAVRTYFDNGFRITLHIGEYLQYDGAVKLIIHYKYDLSRFLCSIKLFANFSSLFRIYIVCHLSMLNASCQTSVVRKNSKEALSCIGSSFSWSKVPFTLKLTEQTEKRIEFELKNNGRANQSEDLNDIHTCCHHGQYR
jgi:hypothetical protein